MTERKVNDVAGHRLSGDPDEFGKTWCSLCQTRMSAFSGHDGYHTLEDADGTKPCRVCGLVEVVTQDRLGKPYGNCTAAVIATLMGKPLGAMPQFNLWADVFGDWHTAARAWLLRKGYELSDGWSHEFALSHGAQFGLVLPGEPLLAGGKNPDGVPHMVVWLMSSGLLHEPNPKRRGLEGLPEFVCTLRPKAEPVAEALYALASK